MNKLEKAYQDQTRLNKLQNIRKCLKDQKLPAVASNTLIQLFGSTDAARKWLDQEIKTIQKRWEDDEENS